MIYLNNAATSWPKAEGLAEYMKEADQLAAWHPMCIYDKDSIMGFTMY